MRKAMVAAAALLALAGCENGGDGNQAGTAGNEAGSAAAPAAAGAKAKQSLLDSLGGSGRHASLVNAVKAAGLSETLSGAQPYTLFAPTDDAFAKLPAGTMEALLAPDARGRLTETLTTHIVPGTVTVEDLGRAIDRGKGKAQLATVGGTKLRFARLRDTIVVTDANGGQAQVVTADGAASNGVLHAIDGVLMPQ